MNPRAIFELNKRYRSCKKAEKELMEGEINQMKENFTIQKAKIIKEASDNFGVKEVKINQIISPQYEIYESFN